MLEQIKIDKSPGPDQIHPKLLKSLASDPKFVDSVYKLFICCAKSRQIPSDWKLANVIALHKKGPRNSRGLCYRQPEPGTPPKVDP